METIGLPLSCMIQLSNSRVRITLGLLQDCNIDLETFMIHLCIVTYSSLVLHYFFCSTFLFSCIILLFHHFLSFWTLGVRFYFHINSLSLQHIFLSFAFFPFFSFFHIATDSFFFSLLILHPSSFKGEPSK